MIEVISGIFFIFLGIVVGSARTIPVLGLLLLLLYMSMVFLTCSNHPYGLNMGIIQAVGIMMFSPLISLGFYYRQKHILNEREYVLGFMSDGEPKNNGSFWDKPVSFIKTFRFRLFVATFGLLLIFISHIYAATTT